MLVPECRQVHRLSTIKLKENGFDLRSPAPMPLPWTLPFVCVPLIPSPADNAPPTPHHLVGTKRLLQSGESWSGPRSFQFTWASEMDAYHKLPVRNFSHQLMLPI